ncbi:MAG: carbohydrate ABC transporter permease [Oscillospiraceae bacterium]|nr:carbohydrate ABC transporter permease [Oscillospiraceae bacterium]
MVGERKFDFADACIYLIMFFTIVVTLYPVIYILSNSVSDMTAVMRNKVVLFPIGFDLSAYKNVLSNKFIWTGYRNSTFLLFVGTFINVIMTICAAFPLSRTHFHFRKFFMIMIIFTMFFSGGMIPTFVIVDMLRLTDTIWSMVIPTAVSAINVIIMKSFFESIPASLEEAMKIDGGTDFTVLFKLILPLSKPVLAVISLYYGVAHWNGFTSALIYIRTRSLFPLQVILREMLLQNKLQEMITVDAAAADALGATRSIQYATIIVSIIPMLIIYPFLQKYFVKGVMIGAVKG